MTALQGEDAMSAPFEGKVALVAGASRGIGAVTARAFAQGGAAVVLAARDARALEAVAGEVRAAGGRALAVPTDVGDVGSVEHLVSQTLGTFGRLDAAFNTAHRPGPGGGCHGPLALLGGFVIRDRGRDPDRRWSVRRPQASACVPPGGGHEGERLKRLVWLGFVSSLP